MGGAHASKQKTEAIHIRVAVWLGEEGLYDRDLYTVGEERSFLKGIAIPFFP